ncbi:DMT family transporter [Schaalia sp. 19OD2882]|uniref:DMT family transporter n=1 Tax=Schaalia sp. 19OD2882 TaxID=2794089 RepID=UPI0020A7685C|nr:DMT family transporter [Schaalia sp. 19OD2882]
MESRTSVAPALALVAVTAVWGSTFFMIKSVVTEIPPLDFLGVRFLVAALAVLVVWGRRLVRCGVQTWKRGVIAGAAYSSAQVFQTYGLAHADASVSGFITGMYVVLTPVLLFFVLHRAVDRRVWVAVALSTAGLSVLALNGFAVGVGEMLTLVAAFLYAVHIILLDRWAGQENGLDLAAVQVVAIGVILTLAALPGGVAFPAEPMGWVAIVYMTLIPGLLAIVVQTWAQSRLPATNAAIIMTTEPVFAASFAIALGGESLTWRLAVGGGLVLTAMLLAEIHPKRKATSEA